MGFLVPYVYAPKQGFGFFSFYARTRGSCRWRSLVWHLAYGVFLGKLYSRPQPECRTRGLI